MRQDGLPRDGRELSLSLGLVSLRLLLRERELIRLELLLCHRDVFVILLLFDLALSAVGFEHRLLARDRRAGVRDGILRGGHLGLVRGSFSLACGFDLGESVVFEVGRVCLLLFAGSQLLEVTFQRLLGILQALERG